MVIPATAVAQLGEATYQARFSKSDATLIETLLRCCDGELRKGALAANHGNIEFKLSFLPKQRGFAIAVGCRIAGRIKVTREGALDRWMEGFVPAWRFQSRDARFDRDFRVQTRDLELTSAILTKRTLRAAVRGLFDRGAQSVHVDGEHVKMIGGPPGPGQPEDTDGRKSRSGRLTARRWSTARRESLKDLNPRVRPGLRSRRGVSNRLGQYRYRYCADPIRNPTT